MYKKLLKTSRTAKIALLVLLMCVCTAAMADEQAAKDDLPTAEKAGITLNFTDAPIMAVLNELSARLGIVIVNPPDISERITLVSRQSLSEVQAIDMLNSVLKNSDYTAILTERVLRIIPLSEARTANVAVRSGIDPEAIGQSDTMITQIIPLRYAEAGELLSDMEGLIPEYAHMTSNADSNTLILTAREVDVRHIVEIVSALDIQLSGVNTVRVFALEYADAESTAELIEDIFSNDSSSSSNNVDPRARFMRRMMGGGPGQSQNNNAAGKNARVQLQEVSASYDEQTNAVVVSAPAEIMTIIADVIEQLDDNPTAEEIIFVYPLANADAENLEEILQDIFDEDSGSSSNTDNSAFRGRGGPGGPGRDFSQSGSSTSSDAGDLAGQVYVVADTDTNSLMIRTAPKYLDRVKALLKELDRPTRQVLIKVLIAEVTHDNTLDLGAEFSVLNLNIGSGIGEVGTDFGLSQLSSGMVGKFVSSDFTATLRALQQLGKLEVLSRPYLLGSENQLSSIVVGEEVPYISNSRISDSGEQINTVDYRNIGIILNVTPYIGPNGMVIMDVDQEISSTTGNTVTVSEDFAAEVYATRSAQTRVAVASGSTVVIGGLIQDKVVETVNQVPLLGSIPILGHLFKRTENTRQKTELLIFLSPQVALNPKELKAVSEDTIADSSELSKDGADGKFGKAMNEFIADKKTDPNKTDSENVETDKTQSQEAK